MLERYNISGSESVKGLKGSRNEDYRKTYKSQTMTIISVADGHGGEAYFRSRIGAKLATDAVFLVLKKHFDRLNKLKNPKDLDLEKVKTEILNTWKSLVIKDYQSDKFNLKQEIIVGVDIENAKHEEALNYLIVEPKGKKRKKVKETLITKSSFNSLYRNPINAYGSTILAYARNKDKTYALKLGDGDIVFTNVSQNETFIPFPKEENLIANETYSLANLKLTNFHMREIEEDYHIVVLSSDGIANSFNDNTTYLGIGEMIYNLYIKCLDEKIVNSELKELLTKFSNTGSGDDSTISYYIK